MQTVIPIQRGDITVFCIVIYGKDSSDRILAHDPAIMMGADLTIACGHVSLLHECDFVVAFEEEEELKAKLKELGRTQALIQWLCRGWTNTAAEQAHSEANPGTAIAGWEKV